jgi:hypothetical protein
MPHKCVRCGKVYEDRDKSLLNGCSCGSVFFMYIRSDREEEYMKELESELNQKKTSLESELKKSIDKKFGIETVKSKKEGVYEINIDALLKRKPLIILEKGKTYVVHLPSIFERFERKS